MDVVRVRVRAIGITQGVGFRPTAWRWAQSWGLSGWVQNDSNGLLLELQGPAESVDALLTELHANPPALARLDAVDVTQLPVNPFESGFEIRASHSHPGASTPVSPDVSLCADCLRELTDRTDRRYQYPFVNCTNCGPRFTIIQDLPYDRSATTMRAFSLCGPCQTEYCTPGDRRFHAQPNACPECGPIAWFVSRMDLAGFPIGSSEPAQPSRIVGSERMDDWCAAAETALRAGQIVAVKGIGGFHLVCDPLNAAAVQTLRDRKGRVDKPLSVMVANIAQAHAFAVMDSAEQTLLASQERPIVLLKKQPRSAYDSLLESVAPGNDFVGVLLPYSPIHHLLIERLSPLVVTSGNLSNEPIVRTNEQAVVRLAKLADAFVFHNRDIHVVCDDSVVRSVDRRLLPVRRSRGYAPMPIRLNTSGQNVLAVGGEIKATFCLTKDNYAYLSQHIGDVGNIETVEALQRNVSHYLKLFRVELDAVAGDMHPDYLSTQWARRLATEQNVPFFPIQHHHAHAAALIAEQVVPPRGPIIACCFDGTGYGLDGAVWGGEFLVASASSFERAAQLKYFSLPGGDASIRRPYRTALALLAQYGLEWDERVPSVTACTVAERRVLKQQISGNLNCSRTSSMGRLFDAMASLIGIRQHVSYEAQAAMEMEALAARVIDDVDPDAYSIRLGGDQPITADCQTLVNAVVEDVLAGVDPAVMAAQFHHAVARLVGRVCVRLRDATGIQQVGLTGGVFQNVLLLQLTKQQLEAHGMAVWSHTVVPPNDGGLALGQAVIARCHATEE